MEPTALLEASGPQRQCTDRHTALLVVSNVKLEVTASRRIQDAAKGRHKEYLTKIPLPDSL